LILTLALISIFGLSACGGGDTPVEEGCQGDSDCPRGEVCEAAECVPAPLECEVDAECAVLEICTDNECVVVECKADSDCPAGTCAANVCVDSCLGNHDQEVQCTNDMWQLTQDCLDCISNGANCPAGAVPKQTPIAECLNIALGLSFECGSCYEDFGVCALGCSTKCFQANDPESCECWDCLQEVPTVGEDPKSCVEIFDDCAQFGMMDGPPNCAAPRECN
jgi:Cys-rich repeat protein